MIAAAITYFLAVLTDGDWQNDWRTHLPRIIRPLIEGIGHILAAIVGS